MTLGRPSIRMLLLGANTTVIVLPLLVLAGLRVYDVHLLRQTERQLIAESVLIGEAYREALARELGQALGAHRPPSAAKAQYAPIEPQIDLGLTVLPAQPTSLPADMQPLAAAERAGRSIEPLLARAQTFNLSAIRVLDARGCVVATTRGEAGMCMSVLPEVQSALRGRYTAVARQRISDEPPPPFGDVRRRGKERVFTALPVFSDGHVIAVVRASRTGLDAFSTLWWNRRGLVIAVGILALLSAAVSLSFSAAIAAPLRRLTRAARNIAAGSAADSGKLTTPDFAPSEVAVLADVLQTMTERLTARARYVTEFASNASHELKSPITAIRGAAELLGQHDDMPAQQRARFVQNIAQDAERMERLVTRMLELARVESEAEAPAEQLDVAAVVASVVARYAPRVELSLEDVPATLVIPEPHLRAVVVNLVENALRHGGDKPVQVRVSGVGSGARLAISVRDSGPGISEANQARLFQRFFTTERDRGGTGLGLSIVKAIAEARGGEVSAVSGPGGSTFRVLL